MSNLKIGDSVIWRGAFGKAEPIEAKIENIQLNNFNGSKNGNMVTNISWDKVTERNVIVDLENGHWAWAYQISEK